MRSIESADQRYRAAFERLKAGKSLVLPRGTAVSQNNVAKEAGRDPSALRKTRHPALIREIQAFIELTTRNAEQLRDKRKRQKRSRETLQARLTSVQSQRDWAQSQLLSAQRALLELTELTAAMQVQIDQLQQGKAKL